MDGCEVVSENYNKVICYLLGIWEFMEKILRDCWIFLGWNWEDGIGDVC